MATSDTTRLAGLRRKLAEAKAAEREVAAKPAQLRAELERLDEELQEHDLPADGSPPPAGSAARKPWDGWHAMKVKLDGPWAARLEKARRETAAREAEVAAFVVENLATLLAEIEPDAYEACDAVVSAIADLSSALEGWHDVGSRVSTLLAPVPGIDGRDVPSPPFEPLRQELRRLRAVEIPVPLPRSFYGVDAADEAKQARARAIEAAVGDDVP